MPSQRSAATLARYGIVLPPGSLCRILGMPSQRSAVTLARYGIVLHPRPLCEMCVECCLM